MSKQALEGKRLNAFGYDPDDLVIVGLDTSDGPEHPLFDERAKLPVSEAFVKNVCVHGVLEPVLVRKDGGRVLVVAGRQRVKAARAANVLLRDEGSEAIEVPVMLRRGGDAVMAGVMISENEVRCADELATKLKKLERLVAQGWHEDDLAVAFGVSAQTVRSWLSLTEASKEVKTAVSAGLLSATAGAKIAALPRSDQAGAVEAATKDGKASVAKAGRVAKSKKDGSANSIEPPSKRVLRKLSKIQGPWDRVDAGLLLDWVLGEIPDTEVPHLGAMLKKLGR